MASINFTFSEENFNKLFPFYILIDRELNIISFGKSLKKSCPKINSLSCFSDLFVVKRPFVSSPNFQNLEENINQLVVIESKQDDLMFRGQFEYLDDKIIFLGSPWFVSMKQVSDKKLTLHDFALNDPLLDLLHVLNNQEITTQELKESLIKVNDQKNKFIASENRLSTLIKNLQTGILLEDQNRKIILANNKFCNMFGFDVEPEKLIGVDCSNSAEETKHFFKDENFFVSRINEILLKKEVVFAEEVDLVDGRVLERSYVPIMNDQDCVGHLWSYEDVTFKKSYEKSLENEKEKYSRIIANMNLGLVEVNLKNEIVLANQSFCNLTGYSSEELIGVNASRFLLTDESKKTFVNKKKLRGKGVSDSYEIEALDKNLNLRHWLVSGAPNFDSNGVVNGSVGILLDITEQKEMEIKQKELLVKLEKQNNQLNEYAQIISHDLKSPLRSIHALVDWIKEDESLILKDESLSYFEMIQSKVEMLDYLIEGVLAYSKIDQVDQVTESVDLQEVVQNCIKMIHLPDHIKIEVLDKLPVIQADNFRMQQLFQNIITNAVNFIDKPQGIIRIDSKEEKGYYIFSIQDNGIGIDKDNFKKIFQTFQKFTKREKSTGLGLSIVKKIVDTYKGEIWVESELSVGTTFYIKLKK